MAFDEGVGLGDGGEAGEPVGPGGGARQPEGPEDGCHHEVGDHQFRVGLPGQRSLLISEPVYSPF